MEPSIQSAKDLLAGLDGENPIVNVLKATLEYPADTTVKATKLANDIDFFAKASTARDGELWDVWWGVIAIAKCLPSGHPCQESLIQAVVSLSKREDIDLGEGESGVPWKDLPYLAETVRESWLSPAIIGPTVEEECAKWLNYNSFLARLTHSASMEWLHFAVWEIRGALEEKTITGPAMRYRLLVAAEWLTHCTSELREFVGADREREELTEYDARVLRTGELCDNIAPLGSERWKYWKTRLADVAADLGVFELQGPVSESLVERVAETLKIMAAVDGVNE